jgi:UPF0755 protein
MPESSENKKSRLSFGRVLGLAVRAIVAVLVLITMMIFIPGPGKETKIVVVPHGASIYTIASILGENYVSYNPVLFCIAAKVLGHNSLKAGEYEIDPHQSMAHIALMMHNGQSIVRLFTVAEGKTSAEVLSSMDDIPLTGAMPEPPAEGSLLPETYRYSYGDSRPLFIVRMQKGMHEMLTSLWNQRDPAVPLKSPQEALVMASIIEKETAKPEERSRIARVFYNRLKNNMKLQSDPTVIYALTQGKQPLDRALTHQDMEINSPYNTYIVDGLPPGPICNPGRASIEAALHPRSQRLSLFRR